MCVHPVLHGGRGIHWIADAPVHVRMTDRIGNVMVYKSGQIGDGFLLLLARADGSNTAQTALKKGVYLVFVHIGTDVAVIAVAQDRDIIEKHIRSLQTELVEPAVFGDRVF